MITVADLETLNRATLELYSPDLHAGNWVDRSFRFLSILVSADMVNYGRLDPRTGVMEAMTTCDRSFWPTAASGFAAFMKKYPCFCFDPSVNGGKPFFRSDFISGRQFRDMDIYCECFRILETMDHAAVYVPTDDGYWTWFAAERRNNDFDERERMLFTLAQAHLINSRKLALARQKVRSEFPIDTGSFCRAGFTPRESEVAYWLTEGKTNAEIAVILKLQTQTVKAHVAALFNKTGTGNRLALVLHLMEITRTLLRAEKDATLLSVRNWNRSLSGGVRV